MTLLMGMFRQFACNDVQPLGKTILYFSFCIKLHGHLLIIEVSVLNT